jgi:hypothetical protein
LTQKEEIADLHESGERERDRERERERERVWKKLTLAS